MNVNNRRDFAKVSGASALGAALAWRSGFAAAAPKANQNIPYTADEIAADAVACRKAGASIIYFHPQQSDGALFHSTSAYRDFAASIRACTDVLVL